MVLCVNAENVLYFDSFEVEYIPKEILKFKGNKSIILNIYRIQAFDSIMCGYFYIGFIDFIDKDEKTFLQLWIYVEQFLILASKLLDVFQFLLLLPCLVFLLE